MLRDTANTINCNIRQSHNLFSKHMDKLEDKTTDSDQSGVLPQPELGMP